MNGFGWLGVVLSAFTSTLALASWIVMAMPYFDDAPYLTELRRRSGAAFRLGLLLFAVFFALFYAAAQTLDESSSGPLIAGAGLVVSLPISMLLGSETWDRYDGHGMNKVPGVQAVAVATGIGLVELAGVAAAFMLLLRL